MAAARSLLDCLEDAVVKGGAGERLGTTTPAARPSWSEEFDALEGRRWRSGREIAARLAGRDPERFVAYTRLERDPDGATGLVVPPAAGGIHWDVTGGSTPVEFVARLRLRPAQGGEGSVRLQVSALSEAPEDVQHRAAAKLVVPAAVARATDWEKQLRASGEEWHEIAVAADPLAQQKGWRVSLVSEDAELLVDRMAGYDLGPADWLSRSPRLAGETAVSPLRRKVTLGDRTVDSLVLTGGSSLALSVPVPRKAPRLDVFLGALASPGAEVELVISAGGRELARVAGAARFEPAVIPLDAFAGHDVALELAVEGDAAAVGAFGAPWLLGARERPPPGVLLVSLDTLRADFLGCYGFPQAVSPRLDAFAQEGLRFERAYSPTCYTLPAHASLLTGQHTLEHGVLHPRARASLEQSHFLAQTLRAHGYCTAAFTGGGFLNPAFGFSAGIDFYDVSEPAAIRGRFEYTSGEPIGELQAQSLSPVLDWIDRFQDQPFFLLVHTYVVHNYVAEQRYLDATASWFPPHACSDDLQGLWDRADGQGDREAALHLQHVYAAAVLQADERTVGGLLERLDELGLSERTLVVITSDHGDEFLEHARMGHGYSLYQEVVRVPMLWRGPGIAPAVRTDVARLQDVAPSVLDFLDLPVDPRMTGRSLFAGTENERALFYHSVPGSMEWEGVVETPWKYLRHRDEEDRWRESLFRLGEGDHTDLLAEHPELGDAFARELDELHAGRGETRPEGEELGEEALEALRRLGYLDD